MPKPVTYSWLDLSPTQREAIGAIAREENGKVLPEPAGNFSVRFPRWIDAVNAGRKFETRELPRPMRVSGFEGYTRGPAFREEDIRVEGSPALLRFNGIDLHQYCILRDAMLGNGYKFSVSQVDPEPGPLNADGLKPLGDPFRAGRMNLLVRDLSPESRAHLIGVLRRVGVMTQALEAAAPAGAAGAGAEVRGPLSPRLHLPAAPVPRASTFTGAAQTAAQTEGSRSAAVPPSAVSPPGP